MTVDGGIPEPRETAYDLDAAVAQLTVPGLEFGDQLDGTVLAPYDPESGDRLIRAHGRPGRAARRSPPRRPG